MSLATVLEINSNYLSARTVIILELNSGRELESNFLEKYFFLLIGIDINYVKENVRPIIFLGASVLKCCVGRGKRREKQEKLKAEFT